MPFFGEALRSIHRPELARGRFTLAWNLSGMLEHISLGSALCLGTWDGPSGVGTRMASVWGDQPKRAHGGLLLYESLLVWTHFPGWCLLQ